MEKYYENPTSKRKISPPCRSTVKRARSAVSERPKTVTGSRTLYTAKGLGRLGFFSFSPLFFFFLVIGVGLGFLRDSVRSSPEKESDSDELDTSSGYSSQSLDDIPGRHYILEKPLNCYVLIKRMTKKETEV